MKFYNELEQSWRKLKADHPEVAKAIKESDKVQNLFSDGVWADIRDPLWSDNGIYRAPMQTEAEKFLEKWEGKKIWQEGMWRHSYHLVTGAMDHNRVHIKDQDGQCGYIVLRVSDNWQLWEPPKPKLDARKVAGWWSKDKKSDYIKLLTCVHMNGTTDPLEGYTFSQDPMKPLDQWQTLSEICGGES
jgi:hypothetical protein